MKKTLSGLLALMIFVLCFPAYAEETLHQEDIFTYTVANNQATITNVEDARRVVVIPESLNEYPVVKLADGALGGSAVIEEVYLPDSLTTIGSLCFAYSDSIKTITFGEKLKTIEDGAFLRCRKLWTITLPDSVETIGDNAFGLCTGLTAVTLPDNVKKIGKEAFPISDALRIYAKTDSVAHNYARSNNLSFEEYIHVTVNGKEILFDQPCITNTEHYRTMVPMRAVLEDLGAEITWDETFNTAGITVLGTRLLIRPNEPFMMVNGVVRYLSCPSIEFNGRIMVPIRDVMEAIGGTVGWDEVKKLVSVTCKVPESGEESPEATVSK